MPGRTDARRAAPRSRPSWWRNLITNSGADRVLTVDLHAGQIQGFFDIPTDNLFASPVMVRDIKERFRGADITVVSPDVGGVVRARGLAKRINAPLAIIDKRREHAGESEVMNVIGEVAGTTCILIDDIVDQRRYAGQRRGRAAGTGRNRRLRLYHPRRAVGRRGRAHYRLAAEGTRHHRLDPADRGRARRAQHPCPLDRNADRRSHRPHRDRGVGFESVRLARGRATPEPFASQGHARTDPTHRLETTH